MELYDEDERTEFDPDTDGSSVSSWFGMGRRKASRNRKKARVSRKNRARQGKRNKSKRHATSGRIKYTKRGQPYIILKSGKARFMKKK